MAEIFFKKNINGSILDVGGGGEGMVDVLVNCDGEEVKTTYGVGKLVAKQNAQTFVDLAMDVGLKLVRCSEDSGQFFLQFERVGQSR